MKNQNTHKSQGVRGKTILVIAILASCSAGCGASSAEPPAAVTEQVPSATAKPPTELPTSALPTEMFLATLTPFDLTDTLTTAKPPTLASPTERFLATLTPFISPDTPTFVPTFAPKEGWVDFVNGYYGYAISLPSASVVSKNEKIDHVQAERPAGMESGKYFDKLNRTYPPGICVSVSYQSVYLNIRVQYSLGGFFVDPCGPGIKDYPYLVSTEEEVFVGETSYPATYIRVYESDAPGAKSLEEFYYVDMGDGERVFFGGEWKDQAAYEKYLNDKAVLLEILRSYRSVPKTALFCPEPAPTRLKAGGFAYVSTDLPLSYLQQSFKSIRNAPGLNQELIGSIDTGKAVELLEGPVCNNSLQWWKVRVAENSLVGWAPEGDYLTPEGYHESSWLIPCESKENCGTP
ncbi:MAG TPA: SH3 domain-containing protein [Anaerolineales bacterium]|nr:SH3 domain-containing protein [Anaerolineales bacterium]